MAHGRVVRAGRTISVCRADAVALDKGRETIVATLTGTMMCVEGRGLAG
jgi:acyl-coenzyme A thioesterase PaaI-like protein